MLLKHVIGRTDLPFDMTVQYDYIYFVEICTWSIDRGNVFSYVLKRRYMLKLVP